MKLKLNKTMLSLLLIVTLAIILRTIVTYSLDPGVDELIYSVMGLDFISSGQLSTLSQSPLYFYTLDIIYRFFGLQIWTMRLLNIILGSLTALLLYLIGKELFNDKKKALLASFLFAISSYALIYNVEMNTTSIFFALLSLLFFTKGIHSKKENYFYASAVFLGIGYLFKEIAILLLPAYIIYYFFDHFYLSEKEKRSSKLQLLKVAGISLLILFLFFLPVLTHNYLAYTQKGVVDQRFSKYLRLDLDVYKNLGSRTTAEFDFTRFSGTAKSIFVGFLKEPTFLLLLFLFFGLIVKSIRDQIFKDGGKIFLLTLCIAVPWVFYSYGDGGRTHNLLMVPFFALLSAYSLITIKEKYLEKCVKNQKTAKQVSIGAILLLTVITIMLIYKPLSEETPGIELMKYAETIPPDAITLIDPRIYNAPIALAFSEKHYVEGSQLNSFFEAIQNAPGKRIEAPYYYIECAWDKACGWKQEDHDRVAAIGKEATKVLTEKTNLDHEIYLGNEVMFRIHKGILQIPPAIYPSIDQSHYIFYYPIGWKNKSLIYDGYTPKTFFEHIIYNISRAVLHLAFVLALLGIAVLFYLLKEKPENKVLNQNT